LIHQRVVDAAQELGISPHAFMIDAIGQAAHAVEKRAAFIKQARQAKEEMLKIGDGHAADDIGAYLRRRLEGGQVARPSGKP